VTVENVIVEADGGSRGNPGPAGCGAVVLDAETGVVLAECSEFLGTTTNNVAEYRGLIAGLRAARDLGARQVSVRCDSKLVVEQMKGTWQVKNEGLRPLAREAVALRAAFDRVSFTWIPRERNRLADRLANEAMDRRASAPVHVPSAADHSQQGESPVQQGESPVQQGLWVPDMDAPTRLILVRHGSTEHSADKRFSGRNHLPLSAVGERQADALAGYVGSLAADGVAAVVSSPLRRARQTAAAICAKLGLEASEDDGFAELDFGTWEGLTFAEARAANPAALSAWLASGDAAPPGGESFVELARRVRRARDSVLRVHSGTSVVVVTHVSPIKTLLRVALDAPVIAMFRMHLDIASVSIVDYFGDGNASVRLVNDTGHLRSVPRSER
jgi:ribonuclease H / adenosylcobalamin/alpha-ribazole phosphatase